MPNWQEVFASALPYDAFLEVHGTPERRARWEAIRQLVHLDPSQKTLAANFPRTMYVCCLAATWCGDCANQSAILDAIARCAPRVHLAFVDRDSADPGLVRSLQINGGQRIPIAVFLSEDFQDCGHYGDRTLSFYREMGAQLAAPACSTGLVPPSAELLAAGVREWLVEFERIQWMLRLTGRLRELHND